MDRITPLQRSFNMSRVKSKDTSLELKFRQHLVKSKLFGYRLNVNLFGKPDIVFPKRKVVIFIDGCFWHKCFKCFKLPTTRSNFWLEKINNNVNRDLLVNEKLKLEGWLVLRLPEHEIKKHPDKAVSKVKALFG